MKRFLIGFIFMVLLSVTGFAENVLLVDKAMLDPLTFKPFYDGYKQQGFNFEYRRYHPSLVKADVEQYKVIMVAGGGYPAPSVAYLSNEEGELLKGFVENGGTAVLMYSRGDSDTYIFNKLFESLGLKVKIDPKSVMDPNGYKSTLIPSSYYLNLPYMTVSPKTPLGEGLKGYFPAGRVGAVLIGQDKKIEIAAWTAKSSMRFVDAIQSPELHMEFTYAADMRYYPVVITMKAGKGTVIIVPRGIFNMNGYTGRWSDKPMLPPYDLKNNAKFDKNFTKYVSMIAKGEYTPQDIMPLFRIQRIGALAKPEKEMNPVTLDETAHKEDYETLAEFKELPPITPKFLKGDKVKSVYMQWFDARAEYEIKTLKETGINLVFAMTGFLPIVLVDDPAKLEESRVKIETYLEICKKYDMKVMLGGCVPLEQAWKNKKYPTSLVDGNGNTYKLPSPLDDEMYKDCLIDPSLFFAKIAAKYPETVVGFMWDMELYGHDELIISENYSYDDATFALFVKERESLLASKGLTESAKSVTNETRFRWLESNGLLREYYQVMEDKIFNITRNLRDECDKIQPGLTWAFYTAGIPQSWYYKGAFRGFGGEDRDILLTTYEARGVQQTSYYKTLGVNMLHTPGILVNIPEGDEWISFLKMTMKKEAGYWLFPGGCITAGEWWRTVPSDASMRQSPEEVRALIKKANKR